MTTKLATKIPQRVNDCPDDKYLNMYVRGKVCAAGSNKWRDLGIVLMGQDAVPILDMLRVDHPNNIKECCSRMFTEWRQRTPKASWKQLIEALKEVQLTQLASELEESLQLAEPNWIEKQSGIVTSEKQLPLISQTLQHFKSKVNTSPSLKDLQYYFTPQYAVQWKVIGTQLCLPEARLDIIEHDNHYKARECCNAMWSYWLQLDVTASWGKLFTVIESPAVSCSAPDKAASTVQTTATLPCTSTSENQNKILERQPYMIELKKIVIPRIMNQWEYIAEALYYNVATISTIKLRGLEGPKQYCEEFFKDWLTTNNGARAGPKVWSTLIDALKEVDEISTDIVEDIVKEVMQLK